jgi:acyl carrier protein
VPDRVPEVITDDTVVNNDMAIDSMGFILVICRCEAELGVKIPERRWQKLSTFGEVVDEFMLQLKKANK